MDKDVALGDCLAFLRDRLECEITSGQSELSAIVNFKLDVLNVTAHFEETGEVDFSIFERKAPLGKPTQETSSGNNNNNQQLADSGFILPATVIDIGSGFIKAGIASDPYPKSTVPSLVGVEKYQDVMGRESNSRFVGKRAIDRRGVLALEYPIKRGNVSDWDAVEELFRYVFDTELRIEPSERPLLLTRPPLSARSYVEKLTELMFETFQVPMLHLSIQGVLGLYASGQTTGFVLDSGHGVSHTVPVYEGYALSSAVQRLELGGSDLTDWMRTLLAQKGFSFATSAEQEIVRDIKEKCCFVSQELVQDQRNRDALAGEGGSVSPDSKPENTMTYELPDGHVIELGDERFRCPEALFQPQLLGREHGGMQSLVETVMKIDIDLRASMLGTIVLSGGNTMFPGFAKRLKHEVVALVPARSRVSVIDAKDRDTLVWTGGSILASLPQFPLLCVHRAEYDENGPEIAHRKFI
eukprot:c26820_g1_i1.p1 GENE.c26820_g1_i1~~c26820_g1_i1.p1  ORF type:complete len:469 (+),score=97.19 c26820_g1_i1:66-1472(+)